MSEIVVGPWGGYGGFAWDDGQYSGVREIILYHDHSINSITLVYDDDGKPVASPKHGGNGGRRAEIKLKYPDEFLVGARGRYHPFRAGTVVIRSLVLRSNVRTFGPYGTEEGEPFTLPMEGGQIAGFKGRCEEYVHAIGFYITSIPAEQTQDEDEEAEDEEEEEENVDVRPKSVIGSIRSGSVQKSRVNRRES